MRSRSWALAVVVLAMEVVGAACSDPLPAGPDGGGVACAADGNTCTDNIGCCSYRCQNGACGGVVNDCTEDNLACISDLQCCSMLCNDDGFCGIPGGPGTCVFEDGACKANADCCSNTCTDAGVCTVGADGCTNDYQRCVLNADCCGLLCSNGVCAHP